MAIETNSVSLTRLETASVIGAIVVLVSLLLPWSGGLADSVSGLAFTWLSPAFVVGAGLALVLAILTVYSRLRFTLLALVGVVLTAVGVILLLGMPPGTTGIGVVIFTLGSLVVAAGGYGSLVRESSTYKATAIVCVGSLLVVVVGAVLTQTA